MDTTAQLALGAALLAGALAVAAVMAFASGRAQQQALVERLTAEATGVEPPRSGARRAIVGVDRRLRRTRLGHAIQIRLAATGLDMTAGELTL